jgi:hypothetical protein
MTTIRRGIVLAAPGLLATAAGARADSPGELGASSARPFVTVLATYSPPPRKR